MSPHELNLMLLPSNCLDYGLKWSHHNLLKSMQSWSYEQKIKTNTFDGMRLLGNPLYIDKDKAPYLWKTLEMFIHNHCNFCVLGVPSNVIEVLKFHLHSGYFKCAIEPTTKTNYMCTQLLKNHI
jgi:hypothetical protein